MTLKTRKKHTNQRKDTQDRPRLDPGASRQSSRQDNSFVQPGNLSGAGSEGGDEYAVSSDNSDNSSSNRRDNRGNRGNRQGGNS